MTSFTAVPYFIVHSYDHVRCVLTAARNGNSPVVFRNSTETLRALGPAWFAALSAKAAEKFPDVQYRALFACGDAPGFALAALRLGLTFFERPGGIPACEAAISAICKAGCVLMEPAEMLDLVSCDDPATSCRTRIDAAYHSR